MNIVIKTRDTEYGSISTFTHLGGELEGRCKWPAGPYGENCNVPGEWRDDTDMGDGTIITSHLCNEHLMVYIQADEAMEFVDIIAEH